MKGESVMYEGRQVLKEGFRAYVYGLHNQKELTNSWDEYLHHIESGLWASNELDVEKLAAKEPAVEMEKVEIPHKPKRKKRGS